MKKYRYYIEFIDAADSLMGTKYITGVSESLQKESKASFEKMVARLNLNQVGNSKRGKLVNADGKHVADYELFSTEIA